VSHVTATTVGTKARVKNSDGILHNTHGFLAKVTVFNLALPNRDQMIDITKRLTKPGVVRVLCDAHPHMFAWMIVHDSPYVAVTDENGVFKIDSIPAGTYKVTMWHEGFRPKAVELGRAFGAKLTGCHVYAARLHDYRFKQMEYTLPEEYKDENELERQRKIHDSLIAMGLQLISDSYLDVMARKADEAGLAFDRKMVD